MSLQSSSAADRAPWRPVPYAAARAGSRCAGRHARSFAIAVALCAALAALGADPARAADAVRIEHITDPTLNNMVAFDVRVPAKWHFQGTVGQGGGHCVGVPFQIFRLTSPDGLSFFERMPVLGWSWIEPAGAIPNNTNDCLPLKGPMGAQDFLKYLASTLNVEYVADEPVPATESAAVQRSANAIASLPTGGGARMPQPSVELARAIVRYRNGSFVMKGLLEVERSCMEIRFPGFKSVVQGMPSRQGGTSHQCNAAVRYTVTPESSFRKTLDLLAKGNIGAEANPAWVQALMDRTQRQGSAMLRRAADQDERARAASAAQFNHDQAVRQQMHEQFLATMQRGTDASMAHAAQVANSNHTIASDWVDYSLDRQTVRDPGTGQLSKVSSAYATTWVDGSGKVSYQTNDPNADPNGSLPGTWTRQQVVHGDGSAR